MRSLVIAAWVACPATAACDASTPAADTIDGAPSDADGSETADVPETIEAGGVIDQDAAVVRDTSEVELTLECPIPELAAEVVVGRDGADWCFEVLAAGAELEIVRGIQGGIHVELRLALTTPSSGAPSVSFVVEVVAEGGTLARFASGFVALQPLGVRTIPTPGAGEGSAWATPAFPVVFASADAALFHGRAAEVHARVEIAGRAVDIDPIDVYLLDPTASALPPP